MGLKCLWSKATDQAPDTKTDIAFCGQGRFLAGSNIRAANQDGAVRPALDAELARIVAHTGIDPHGLAVIVGAVVQVAGGECPCGAEAVLVLLQRRLVAGDDGALDNGLVYFGPCPTSVVRSPAPFWLPSAGPLTTLCGRSSVRNADVQRGVWEPARLIPISQHIQRLSQFFRNPL